MFASPCSGSHICSYCFLPCHILGSKFWNQLGNTGLLLSTSLEFYQRGITCTAQWSLIGRGLECHIAGWLQAVCGARDTVHLGTLTPTMQLASTFWVLSQYLKFLIIQVFHSLCLIHSKIFWFLVLRLSWIIFFSRFLSPYLCAWYTGIIVVLILFPATLWNVFYQV